MHIKLFKKFQTNHSDVFKVQIAKIIDLVLQTVQRAADITALGPLKLLFSFVLFYKTIV